MARSRRNLALAAAALLVLAAGPAAAAKAKPKAAAPAAAAKPGVPADAVTGDMSLGNPKARVHVIEYASASCPHCAHFNEEVFPAFKAKYVDTGRVFYTLKEYLTPPEDVASAGFLLARCGGKAKYFTVLDQVFRSQAQWQTTPIYQVFVKIGQANGLSEDQVKACITDEAAATAQQTRVIASVQTDKVQSTPTFDINGKRIEGAAPLSDLDAAIAAAETAAPKAPVRKAKKR
ncbi:MAG: DsbA family protein [Phenylobacterium sp.]|nr:MAG: DsbA family protein [Phenylobacterium sp.]